MHQQKDYVSTLNKYLYIFCEFKHVHTSRLGVHEAVAFISGTFALKLKARRGLVVPKTTRDHPGKRFALGRRHWGEDTHFQVDIHRLRAVIFKVGWKHQCFRIGSGAGTSPVAPGVVHFVCLRVKQA